MIDRADEHTIADKLLLYGSHVLDPGLLHGKMGMMIYLLNYANKYRMSIYEEYAYELFYEISILIQEKISYDYAHGLCGIGVGIEYLAQKGFIENNTDDILEQADNNLFNGILHDPERITPPLLIDYANYLFWRLKNPQIENVSFTTHQTRLASTLNAIENRADSLVDNSFILSDLHSLLKRLKAHNLCRLETEKISHKFKEEKTKQPIQETSPCPDSLHQTKQSIINNYIRNGFLHLEKKEKDCTSWKEIFIYKY